MSTRSLKLALCATACMLAAPARAADTASATPPAQSTFAPNGAVETVIVTARRRAEDVQKVPAQVTALSASDLRIANVKSAIDLQNLAPSLSVSASLGSRDTDVFSIRGQSQPFGGADPGVQTYFADVPFGASGPGNEFDMGNIQVLNGPQGTLYGKNTTGGAVLFEPKKPTDEFGAYLDGQVGDFNLRELQGAVNIPVIGDQFDVRVAGDFARRDGFTQDLSTGQNLDNVDYDAFRIGATIRPFSHFENYTVFDYLHDHNNGTGSVLSGVNTTTIDGLATLELQPLLNPFGLQSCPLPSQYGGYPLIVGQTCGALLAFEQAMVGTLQQQGQLGPRVTTSSISPNFKRDTWNVIDVAKYDFSDHLRLKNIFGFVSDKQQSGFDYDGSALPILEIPNNRTWESNSLQVTDEFQASGESDNGRLKWIAGFYHELDHPGGYSEVIRQTFGGAQAPGGNPLSGFGTTEIDDLANGGTSNALYASATYDESAWLKGLSFTLGGRYTWDHKDAFSLSCILPEMGPACPFPIPNAFPYNATGPVNQSASFHAPSWTVDADYQVSDDSMVYATYRRGYKSGGFNSGAGAAAAGFGEFKPEFLTDVELGSKNNWTIIGVPGRTNLDVYYGWYNDVQKNDLVDVEAPGFFEPVALTFNAAKANIKGLEFQTTIIPEENLEINMFYSYTDATYQKFALPQAIVNGVPAGVNDLSGSPFAYTPKNKLGLTPRFHIPIDTNLGVPYIGGSLYWQSSEWFSDLATVQNTCSAFVMPSPPPGSPYTCLAPGGERPEQKAYALVNFRFDWNNFLGHPVDASVFVNNAFNKTYQVGANALLNLTGTNASIYAPPRMWGVELRYRIGADANSTD